MLKNAPDGLECRGAPHLVSAGVLVSPAFTAGQAGKGDGLRGKPQGSGQLHCQREYDQTHASYTAEAPGRCRCVKHTRNLL